MILTSVGLLHNALLIFSPQQVIKGAGTSNPDHNMMDEAGFIINKCGRLPKLIVALGNYFNKAPNIIQEMRSNANFMYELKTSKGLDSFRDVFTTMHSSFQACPQVLKKCIFYLSLFTQSSIIRRSRLVRRWIAEGYCEGLDSNSKVEFMDKLLGNLGALGMIDKPAQTSAMAGHMSGTSFQVNSLFLDYIISQETKENIFLPLEITVLQGESSLNVQRAGQHLAIGSSWKRDKFVLDSLDFSRLRSLTVSREWRPFFISHRMRVLRVLDLEDTNLKNDDVEQIVAHLLCLKFLSIRRCAKVSCLPDSLGGLNQLQTLDIRHTYVAKLPVSISKLRMLQYVRAGTSVALMDEEPSTTKRGRYGHVAACDGVKVPIKTAALISLHTLGVINISATSDMDIQQLFKNLTQLRKLGVSGINRRNIKGFFSAIEGHVHLESLSLQLHMEKDLEWLHKITTPRNLQRLKMKVHVEKFEHWSCLRVLGQIRRLQTLRLHFKIDQDVELQFCDQTDGAAWSTPIQFCELKVLEIACSSNLHVKFADREMKELELLQVRCSDGSSLNFSGLEHTTALKHVSLKGSFDDTVKEELRQTVAQHTNRPTLKLVGPRSS